MGSPQARAGWNSCLCWIPLLLQLFLARFESFRQEYGSTPLPVAASKDYRLFLPGMAEQPSRRGFAVFSKKCRAEPQQFQSHADRVDEAGEDPAGPRRQERSQQEAEAEGEKDIGAATSVTQVQIGQPACRPSIKETTTQPM